MDNKKSSGFFMKACLVIAALWLLSVAVIVVYFHAIGRPLDPVVAAFLFSPGIGELGFNSLIKTAKEKGGAESAETEIAALRAELDVLKPKPARRAAAPAPEAAKVPTAARDQKLVRAMLEQMLPSLITDAERTYGIDTGLMKLSYVLEKVYARLPDAYKITFSPDQLGGMVDKALAIAKELWLRNPSLIGKQD